MRAAKVQASLRIRAVSPEPSLLAHTSSESRGTFRQKARSLAPLNGWACAVKICHDGMLEDTKSLGAAHFITIITIVFDDSFQSKAVFFCSIGHLLRCSRQTKHLRIETSFRLDDHTDRARGWGPNLVMIFIPGEVSIKINI